MTEGRFAVEPRPDIGGSDAPPTPSRLRAWSYVANEWMGRRGLMLAAFLTPLAFVTDRHDTFATPKLMVLAVSALLALGIWRGRVPRVMAGALVFTAGVLTLASLFSTDHFASIVGGALHADGLVTLVLATVLVLGAAQARSPSDVEESLVSAGALAGLYGVVQVVGLDPMKWAVGPEYGNAALQSRAFATFGSPNFLGLFCAAVLPLAITVAVRRGKLGLVAVVAIVAGVFATESRAAVVGALVGVLLVAGRMHGRHRRIATLTLLGLLLALPFTAVAERFRATNPVEGSAAVRVDLWRVGWQAAQQRPLFGYGPGTTSQVINRSAESKIVVEARTHPSAHNLVLDIALSTGVLGLVAFLTLVAAAWRPLWTHPVLFAGLAAWGAGVLLGFADIPTLTAAALMLGMGLREEPTLKWPTRPLALATFACTALAAWLYLANR